MKKMLFAGFLVMALCRLTQAQPLTGYTNVTSVTSPPQIVATNFVNKAPFEFTSFSLTPFSCLDVLTFTNTSIMYCDTGFLFDLETTNQVGDVSDTNAITFNNGNTGQIFGGRPGETPELYVEELGILGFTPAQLIVAATNIFNTGLMEVDVGGVIDISGKTLNLTRGTLQVEGWDVIPNDLLSSLNAPNLGINTSLDGVGLQSNLLSIQSFTLPSPSSPASIVKTATGIQSTLTVPPPLTELTPFPLTTQVNVSNVSHQVVFINTNLPGITTSVRFAPSGDLAIPTIQWMAVVTNITGQVVTNFLYLQDTFGALSNFSLTTNNFTFTGVPQLAPINYIFTRSYLGFTNLTVADSGYDPKSIFAFAFGMTNQFTAFEADIAPVAFAPDPTAAFSSLTNLPGRIVLTAQNDGSTLDLSKVKIGGANYLSLNATNHFIGSAGAQIVVPNMNINLGTTNGLLTVSNLVAPSIPRFDGIIDMYSARWTNIVAGFTNVYHVLFVSANLSGTAPVQLQNLLLRSTNVVMNDQLNVISNLFINAVNVTLGVNDPTSQIPFGMLNLENPAISWPDSVPVVQNFTNWGSIEASPAMTFADQSGAPYLSFVNHGLILAGGETISANYFEDSQGGLIESLGGPISVIASNAVMSGGEIIPEGNFFEFVGTNLLITNQLPIDIDITTGSLEITNQVLQASGALTFSISSNLSDGGALSGNFWTSADGVNLLQKPTTGDFLGTTVTLTSPPGLEVDNIWDGMDRGLSTKGFLNNGAMGHLILNGGDADSTFFFGGPDMTTNYAMYVDLIDLQNGATNRITQDGTQVFTAFDIPTNMTVYFADAVIGQFDVSEKLNGANGGRLVWVPAYAGIFSSTPVLDSNGNTYLANRALVESDDIDSDGDGLFNNVDSTPLFTASDLNMSVSVTNLPPKVPVIKWTTVVNSTNFLYFLDSLTSTNPVVVTNFVATNGSPSYNAATRTARVVDKGRTNSVGFYQVQVNPAQP